MKSIPKIKVVIFDFDGVIVESNGIKDKAFEEVFKDFPSHYDTMMDYHQSHVSISRVQKFEHLLRVMGRQGDKKLMNSLMEKFSNYSLLLMREVAFVPGAKELLQSLQGMPIYLASVTPIEDLICILEYHNLRHFFTDVYGCPPWTKPAAILEILRKNAIGSNHALLIGDSEGDLQSSIVTGVHFIARDSGLPFSEPPEIGFNNLFEVSEYLKSNIG